MMTCLGLGQALIVTNCNGKAAIGSGSGGPVLPGYIRHLNDAELPLKLDKWSTEMDSIKNMYRPNKNFLSILKLNFKLYGIRRTLPRHQQ